MKMWLRKNYINVVILFVLGLLASFLYVNYSGKVEREKRDKAFLQNPVQANQLSLAKAKAEGLLPSHNINSGTIITATSNKTYLMRDGRLYVRQSGKDNWVATALVIFEQVMSAHTAPKGTVLIDNKIHDLWGVYFVSEKNIYGFMEMAEIVDKNVVVIPIQLPE